MLAQPLNVYGRFKRVHYRRRHEAECQARRKTQPPASAGAFDQQQVQIDRPIDLRAAIDMAEVPFDNLMAARIAMTFVGPDQAPVEHLTRQSQAA